MAEIFNMPSDWALIALWLTEVRSYCVYPSQLSTERGSTNKVVGGMKKR
jgi:hypothetical protein